MKLKIVQIGDETTNGNTIVKLQSKLETKTALGVMRKSITYYMAIKVDTLTVKLDDDVDIEIDDFTVTERPFDNPDTGEEMMLKWLSLK